MGVYKNINNLTMPKMIIFDYGHTLIYEQAFDSIKGTQAVMAHAIKNPKNLTVSEVNEFARKLYRDLIGFSKERDIEIYNQKYQNLVYEYLEIELALSPKETEKIYWDNSSPGVIMPYIDEVITYINKRGIRSGVISNISFSGDTLAERINRLIPHNKFEFIIASSEYVYRKPNRLLFELALKKAGLKPQEVWFCGDNIRADIIGASNVGMFPVWYESSLECFYLNKTDNTPPDCDYLHITDWRELIQVLEQLKP